jgi:RNA-directed DNA polymerase
VGGGGDCRQQGCGFDFLGYRFEGGHRVVRKKSLDRFKDRVRSMTKRQQGRSLPRIVADLNPVLRGWFGYFKHARSSTFRALDGFIRRRLRDILRAQEKRPGFGRCADDQRRCPPSASPARFTGRDPKPTPPNAYFATAGLFALDTAWRAARNPR